MRWDWLGVPGLVMLGAAAWYTLYQNQEGQGVSAPVCTDDR
ncbi:hypothetical protein H6S10_14920 [Escherichia coli]|nr:hypothetical protein H6S10_14920 [Escherichia coli]